MQNTKITTSAILPNYNSAEYLPKALESLLNQTEPFTEIIVVDDGSTDNSIAIVESFMQKHPTLRLLKHKKNQGVNPALNTGIKSAIGDYVLLCAADDVYGKNIVELTQQIVRKHPAVGLVCGDAVVTRFDLKEPFYRMLPYPANVYISSAEFKTIAKKSYVGFNSGGGMFINRQLILELGMLHNETRWHGDWLLYFAAALKQGFFYTNTVFIHISMRKASYSEGKQNKAIQDKVMLDTLKIIYEQYPELWDDFKTSALLPHFAIRYIPLFMFDRIGLKFLTPRCIWKCIINNKMITKVGRLFPYPVILGMRKLLRA